MEIVRRFKKMGLWDYIELLENNCYNSHDKEVYFTYLDELRLRSIESISEGATFKLKSLAAELMAEFKKEVLANNDFASTSEIEEFKFIIDEIIR